MHYAETKKPAGQQDRDKILLFDKKSDTLHDQQIMVKRSDLFNVFAMLDDLYIHLLQDKIKDLEGDMLDLCDSFLKKAGIEMGLREYVRWRFQEEEKKVAVLALKQLFAY